MSIRLPNNSRIYPKTIEGFEAIEKCLRKKTPIVVTSVDFDGTEQQPSFGIPAIRTCLSKSRGLGATTWTDSGIVAQLQDLAQFKKAMTEPAEPRRFPAPWRVIEHSESFVVEHANSRLLAYRVF